MRVFFLGLVIQAFLFGCSATSDGSIFGGTGGASSSGSGHGGAGSGSSSGQSGAGGTSFTSGTGGSGGGQTIDAEVFAHSPDTLFRLDPLTKNITTVGLFAGCDSSMIDIALDKNGVMFGTTFSGLFKVDKATAKCTPIASGSYPNSLSFVPKGTVDPSDEALVGYVGSTYVRIDTTTGKVSNIGTLGGGYSSSGDVVSVIGGGTYLTVKGPNCNDCILQVDPTTGALIKLIGPVNHANVFGLAFWGGVAYGFDDAGVLFQIDLTTAKTMDIPFPKAMPGLVFYGAGSTTSAPLVPPK
jgi:hypothetical protein